MKRIYPVVKKNQWILLCCLFLFPLSSVYAACCAGHGGVARCDKTTGQQVCKDGTISPTCKCAKSKQTPKKTTEKKSSAKTKSSTKAAGAVVPASTTSPQTTTPKKPKSTWWGSSSNTNTNNATTTNPGASKNPPKTTNKNKGWFGNQSETKSAKGCCSNHGGVAQCNRSTGFQMCRDGSTSPSCRCQ